MKDSIVLHRATYTNEVITQEDISKYIERKQSFADYAYKSTVLTMIINTDDLNWDGHSRMILDKRR